MSTHEMILSDLITAIRSRRDASGAQSYVAGLLQAETKKAAQKVAEEGAEVAMAAVSEPKEAVIGEMADLLFHLLILCEKTDIAFEEVLAELKRREGVSGLAEKAARTE